MTHPHTSTATKLRPDVVFLDTETLGTRLNSPIWEIAAIRRNSITGEETHLNLFVHHTIHPFYDELPKRFQNDYDARFNAFTAVTKSVAAARIYELFAPGASGCKPLVVGRVPSFDTARIHYQLLGPSVPADCWANEPWSYAGLFDISQLVLGYLRGLFQGMSTADGLTLTTKSDDLAHAAGINAADYARHTAMGDCEWVRAQFDTIGANTWISELVAA